MAGMGPSPNPNARRQNKPTFEWVALPVEGRSGAAPKLPSWRKWSPATSRWWKDLWGKPQATQWEQDGSTLWTLACLYDDLIAGRADAARVSAEMRQHEDRHGLNPKAMNQLRWRLGGDSDEKPEQSGSVVKLRAV